MSKIILGRTYYVPMIHPEKHYRLYLPESANNLPIQHDIGRRFSRQRLAKILLAYKYALSASIADLRKSHCRQIV
jgi:hypothetical protein